MVQCYHCSRNAIFAVGPEGQRIPLCLDCYVKFQNSNLRTLQALREDEEYLTSMMETIAGVPGLFPRYPKETYVVQTGDMTLNNINISQSEIGVLNTGSLEMVDSAITVLSQDRSTLEISAAISKMANAIAQSNELPTEKKDEAIEILGTIGTEAIAPKGKRRSALVKRLLEIFPTSIQTAASLIQIWQTVEPIIKGYFQS